MRSIYIALVFIGLLSLSYGAQTPYPVRPEPQECDGDDKSVVGCQDCMQNMDSLTNDTIPFICATPEDGYFIEDPDSNITVPCPAACGNCTSSNQCDSCRETNGFNSDCTNCLSGFALNNGADINTNLQGVCIPVAGIYSCNTGFFWNSLSNPESKCVPTGTGSCQNGYSTTQDGKTTANITTNCNYCSETNNVSITTQTLNGNNLYYQITECLLPPKIVVRPEPIQCTEGVNFTDSCMECEGEVCVEAEPGYFVSTSRRFRYLSQQENTIGQVQLCMSQCAECDNEKTCKSCPTGSTLVDSQCVCNADQGYSPNIPLNGTKIEGTQFYCVQYSKGFTCAQGYQWSTPVVPIVSANINQAQCVGTNSSYSCYTDNRNLTGQESLSLTSFWNQVPNPTRKCILATSNQCESNYAQQSNTSTSIYSSPLTENCNACVNGKKLVSQNGDNNNQVCTSFSSVLSMTLILLGIVFALLF